MLTANQCRGSNCCLHSDCPLAGWDALHPSILSRCLSRVPKLLSVILEAVAPLDCLYLSARLLLPMQVPQWQCTCPSFLPWGDLDYQMPPTEPQLSVWSESSNHFHIVLAKKCSWKLWTCIQLPFKTCGKRSHSWLWHWTLYASRDQPAARCSILLSEKH